MEQRSPEWWAARCGKVTASRICDVMARTQKGWGTARRHYLDELVAERLSGQPAPQRYVASLERRQELEAEARIAYEFYSDNTVEQVGFIEHPTIPNCGASPDGLIDSDGGLEIKCCDAPVHLETLSTGVIDKDYILQIQFGIACAERKWWDFASYEPTMPEELKLYVQKVPRDVDRIAEIEAAVTGFLAEVDAKVERIKALGNGGNPLELSLEKSIAAVGRKAHVL